VQARRGARGARPVRPALIGPGEGAGDRFAQLL